MTSKSRGHCNNIKVFNQGKSNQIREKSGNLIAKNVWPPCLISNVNTKAYITRVDTIIAVSITEFLNPKG